MFIDDWHPVRPRPRSSKAVVIGAMLGLLGLATAAQVPSVAEPLRPVPASLINLPKEDGLQTAVLAGGCFWGIQGVFQHVEGVVSATSGYAGGSAETASYEQTETGLTGHAEAVRVVFDPQKISYGTLLRIFFSATHDPTQLDRQGPDIGPQYRSAIFPVNEQQANVAANYIKQLNEAKSFRSEIATTIEPGQSFYEAEPYHQDYMYRNPTQSYILIQERPKTDALKRLFPDLYREQPVLAAGRFE
ncbi:peptide-methionine (S)-S-oxide reductase MsrA [Microvirga sp. VF16]|uniref:peptide-methionine (S)-S-oxide reductase MsrA n=1 Tax=Microvirga sp. VF16 TaxID=2807101 RepID=UPI00193CC572|nr:peptide-methionine (S)-S-oxide reductase MsrA [Microvirga sp. VF16]QRM27604.1 peptide-methionine (S)-S-oxide reductase MsrA [Microvirga sp. VF16]